MPLSNRDEIIQAVKDEINGGAAGLFQPHEVSLYRWSGNAFNPHWYPAKRIHNWFLRVPENIRKKMALVIATKVMRSQYVPLIWHFSFNLGYEQTALNNYLSALQNPSHSKHIEAVFATLRGLAHADSYHQYGTGWKDVNGNIKHIFQYGVDPPVECPYTDNGEDYFNWMTNNLIPYVFADAVELLEPEANIAQVTTKIQPNWIWLANNNEYFTTLRMDGSTDQLNKIKTAMRGYDGTTRQTKFNSLTVDEEEHMEQTQSSYSSGSRFDYTTMAWQSGSGQAILYQSVYPKFVTVTQINGVFV